jgi:6-phosphogluconolactonase (cycloisomerase 2 family)
MSKFWRQALGAAGLGSLLAMTGCAGFFSDPNTTGTTGSTGSNTGDYVYVVNQTSDTLTGFNLGSGALTAVTGSPFALLSGLTPSSVEVSRANTYVYVGGAGAIECFSIGTAGALTLVNSSAATSTAKYVALATSPDGKWLLALDGLTETLYTYGINTSTGALSLNNTAPYTSGGSGTAVPSAVRVTPNGEYVIAALGTGGDVVFTFNTTTGVPTQAATLAVASGFTDNSVTIDANSAYVYLARGGTNAGTSGVASYSLGSGGSLTAVQTLATSGNAPFSVVLDSTGDYAYTANRADGTVSGYSVSGGSLTQSAASPYLSGTLVTALARDNSDKYLVAAAFGGASDVTLYALDALTPGKLDAVAASASGTDPAGSIAIAATH